METFDGDWVPKVHPASREVGPEDPFEMIAEPVGGDPEVMLSCIIQEFVSMGLNALELEQMFDSPNYPVLNQLREHFGAEHVHASINAFLGSSGIWRFQETITDDPEEENEDQPELIQVSLSRLVDESPTVS